MDLCINPRTLHFGGSKLLTRVSPYRLFTSTPGGGGGDAPPPLSRKERKAAEEEEYWKRLLDIEAAKEAVEDKYAVFKILYVMTDLSNREAAQVTSGDLARQIHALALTSGILVFYGSASLKVRIGVPKLYRFWIKEAIAKDPRSVPTPNFEKHFKSTDPRKY